MLPKKEVMKLLGEIEKLEKYLGGVVEMKKLPGALFVVDPRKERNAINEARKLNIPIVAIVDTNCDPDEIDYVIPGNDDAIRAIKLISSVWPTPCRRASRARTPPPLRRPPLPPRPLPPSNRAGKAGTSDTKRPPVGRAGAFLSQFTLEVYKSWLLLQKTYRNCVR